MPPHVLLLPLQILLLLPLNVRLLLPHLSGRPILPLVHRRLRDVLLLRRGRTLLLPTHVLLLLLLPL